MNLIHNMCSDVIFLKLRSHLPEAVKKIFRWSSNVAIAYLLLYCFTAIVFAVWSLGFSGWLYHRSGAGLSTDVRLSPLWRLFHQYASGETTAGSETPQTVSYCLKWQPSAISSKFVECFIFLFCKWWNMFVTDYAKNVIFVNIDLSHHRCLRILLFLNLLMALYIKSKEWCWNK